MRDFDVKQSSIYLEFLDVLQQAEEIGGVHSDKYIMVMNAVADEARKRARIATYAFVESLQ